MYDRIQRICGDPVLESPPQCERLNELRGGTNVGDRYIVLPICATPVYVHVVFTHSNSPWPEILVILGFKHPCAKRLMKQGWQTIDFRECANKCQHRR